MERNEPIIDIKAFPFNYNRSQQGSPSALVPRGVGPKGKRFYRWSATVVRTSALKPPLKFAELFICSTVPTSNRSLLSSEGLKISESFSSCPSLLFLLLLSFRLLLFLLYHLVKRSFFRLRIFARSPHDLREKATNRKCLIYLMHCL